MLYVGVDPGLGGAIGVLGNLGFVQVTDMPVAAVSRGKGKTQKRDYLLQGLVSIFSQFDPATCHVGIEAVHSMPGEGVSGAFSFGRGLGILQGIVSALGLPYTMVSPQRWRAHMLADMPKGKGSSLIRAQQLFPSADLSLKKHDGRAESLLIASYLQRSMVTYEKNPS